jgi:hypothetical protein
MMGGHRLRETAHHGRRQRAHPDEPARPQATKEADREENGRAAGGRRKPRERNHQARLGGARADNLIARERGETATGTRRRSPERASGGQRSHPRGLPRGARSHQPRSGKALRVARGGSARRQKPLFAPLRHPPLGQVCKWFWQEKAELYRPRTLREGERALGAALAHFGEDAVLTPEAVQRWLSRTKARHARRWLNAAYTSAQIHRASAIENPLHPESRPGCVRAHGRSSTQAYAAKVLGVKVSP